MIVPDTNVVAYALIEGPQTALARRVWNVDPVWCLPALWRHEYLNTVATYARHRSAGFDEVWRLWLDAVKFLARSVRPVDLSLALQLSIEHNISAYDAQFVALAQQLGVLCITQDRRLRRAFPHGTKSMQEFCASQS